MMVDGLRTGRAKGIKTLLDLGQGPFVTIDYVEQPTDVFEAREPVTNRRSIWFWIHQAPLSEAVELCWTERLERELLAMGPRSRAEALTKALDEALQAALSSGQNAPWMVSWESSLAYVKPMDMDALLDRPALLTLFRRGLVGYGDRAVPLLMEMNAQSHVNTGDMRAWFGAGDYLPDLVRRAFPGLLQGSLDIGGTPEVADLQEALSVAELELGGALEKSTAEYTMDNHGNRLLACLKALAAVQTDYTLPEDLSKKCLAATELPKDDLVRLRETALGMSWSGSKISAPRRSRF